MMLFMVGFVVFVCAILWNEWKHNDTAKVLDRLMTLERIMTSYNTMTKGAVTQLQDRVDGLGKEVTKVTDEQEVLKGQVKMADHLAHTAKMDVINLTKQQVPAQAQAPQKIIVEFAPVPLLVKHREVTKRQAAKPTDDRKILLEKTKKQVKELSN